MAAMNSAAGTKAGWQIKTLEAVYKTVRDVRISRRETI